ncbi:hypothetical protein IFO70_04740 [Phormidium tenue FACHB-886]|nr:hypothetical protein [Phormidium tenue FACHB-886]
MQVAETLLQSQRCDWRTIVCQALDEFSSARQVSNPETVAIDIESASKIWIRGLATTIQLKTGEDVLPLLELHRRQWWRIASLYPDCVWKNRPAPTVRSYRENGSKEEITLRIDPQLKALAKTKGLDLSALLEDAIVRHLND